MANPNIAPFAGDFPAHEAAGDHADAWPSTEPPAPPSVPGPESGPEVDTLSGPEDPPPIDLVTGLPNAALSHLGDDVPQEAEDHMASVEHAAFDSWF